MLCASLRLKEDVSTIDGIISAYYDVISGPKGHVYNAARDESLHAKGALITRVMDDGSIQRHSLKEEQKGMAGLWDAGFYEIELNRIVEQYGNVAHVWSTFDMRQTPDGEAFNTGINSISLYYKDDRWWIASWSTTNIDKANIPAKYLPKKN